MSRSSLRVLYAKMAGLTQPKCATCTIPHGCCFREACEETRRFAKEEYGVELADTGHPRLPFLGPKGCTVAPYLRPICAVHLCERKVYGSGERFMSRYFALRERILVAEAEREDAAEAVRV